MTDLTKALNDLKTALFDALKLPQLVDWLANEIGWISNLSDAQVDENALWSLTVDDPIPIAPYKGEPY